ncbi:site-specific DNA-methyltransferase [Segatella sp.]|uniref:site-specific DNA-methyltransferase n=1 Tax=Segatella sp. TaxID=2974253 RepID=UPI003A94D6B4
MDKLRMQSSNGVEDNITKIAQLFPDCVTETVDERSGQPKHLIDFEKLKQNLSDSVMSERAERYQFTWPDKSKAILLANSPINATLRPCREDSIDFDNTQNLYIEGDNLDVLKCLKETYLHKVKMIYIDPPYNTGNDFVYEDDFAQSSEEYLANSGQFDEQGNRMFTNAESNGRFHTDWLNMIYPRLKVARDLLTDDGVIFISIDDNEVENLRKVCDEVFGEQNFITQINWVSKSGGSADERYIIKATEYILVYTKAKDSAIFGKEEAETSSDKYKLTDKHEEERGKYTLKKLDFRMTSQHYTEALNYPVIDPDGNELWPGGKNHRQDGGWNWRWSKAKYEWGVKNDFIQFVKNNKGSWTLNTKQYQKVDNCNRPTERGLAYRNFIPSSELNTTQGSRLIAEYFESKIFEYAKPHQLICKCMKIANCDKNALILDFFSGSATTAHAVMQLNSEDGGNRKFIMVQLPEKTEEKSEAFKAGYKNICEIGKERIRRAGKKIKEESPLTTQDLDTGFRVLKLDSTNMQDIYYSPKDISQADLFSQVDNVKPDRTGEDLLFQVMLELGATLDSKIETTTVAGKTIYNVAEGYLVACFDPDVTDEVVKAIAQMLPAYAVLRDTSMKDDSTATNFEQIFKTYSPDTVTKIL